MSVATSTKPNVETAVQNLLASFGTAWDKHDARGLASVFAEDADLINPEGRQANGRNEIEQLFQDEHSSRFKTSRMNMTISRIRTLTPDIVVVTANGDVSGVQVPSASGPQTFHSIVTFVVQNERGTWRIVSARPMIPAVTPK